MEARRLLHLVPGEIGRAMFGLATNWDLCCFIIPVLLLQQCSSSVGLIPRAIELAGACSCFAMPQWLCVLGATDRLAMVMSSYFILRFVQNPHRAVKPPLVRALRFSPDAMTSSVQQGTSSAAQISRLTELAITCLFFQWFEVAKRAEGN